MKRREDCLYFELDDLPIVVTPDGRNWVFSSLTTKKWERYVNDWEPSMDKNYKPIREWEEDVLNASLAAFFKRKPGAWENTFANLPELPEEALRPART